MPPYGRVDNACTYESANSRLIADCHNNTSSRLNLHHSHNMNFPQSHYDPYRHVIFTRNASTSTLDLDSSDFQSTSDGKRGSAKNKRTLNNICGINVRLNKSKECNPNLNVQQQQRMKTTRNIYYIKDKNASCEPNIFIVDPRFHKNRKCALQKSLEDVRMHTHNSHVRQHHQRHDACMNNNLMMDRSVKTLPRDFARPKCHYRPSLENFLDNFPREIGDNE